MIEAAATSMFAKEFQGRILGFGGDAAPAFARIVSARRLAGRPISEFHAQIAAIAASTGAVLATRTVGDFAGCDLSLVDPWST